MGAADHNHTTAKDRCDLASAGKVSGGVLSTSRCGGIWIAAFMRMLEVGERTSEWWAARESNPGSPDQKSGKYPIYNNIHQ